MAEQIEISYYGGDADRHILDLYDAGRALYGAARFIYTLENFRVSGLIVERATSARVKFELEATEMGCFTFSINNIIAAIGPEQAVKILNVPFTALLSWITKKMLGDDKKQALEIEREKTMQTALSGMRDVALGMQDVVTKAIASKDASEERQQELIKNYSKELEAIPETRLKALSSKLRPSLVDMARPTSSDAAYMTFSVNKGAPLLYMDERTVEKLQGNSVDDVPELINGKIIQYNIETGWGKIRLSWRQAPYRFSVHRILQRIVDAGILEAMEERKDVWVWFYPKRDKSDNITSLGFERFAKETEIPTV